MHKFDLTGKDTLVDKVAMHLNVLGPGMEDEVLRKLDTIEVITVDHRRIRHLHMHILD